MIERHSSTDTVLALVGVLNGDVPCLAARDILDPMVKIHMDSAEYRGIDVWFKWIHLIRNCGRISDLRIADCQLRCDALEPSVVYLSGRWAGTIRSQRATGISASSGEARYLVRDGRITELWTHRSNYEFIFGRWIRYWICFNIFLGWSVLYFALRSLYKKDDFAAPADRNPLRATQ
jgi:hypothetical protein